MFTEESSQPIDETARAEEDRRLGAITIQRALAGESGISMSDILRVQRAYGVELVPTVRFVMHTRLVLSLKCCRGEKQT